MTPLMYAVKDNRITYLDRLIELGSDIGARNNVIMFEFCVDISKFVLSSPRSNRLLDEAIILKLMRSVSYHSMFI